MDINGKLIHFTGIGGISMSALACFAIMNGAYVTGSDLNGIDNKEHLASLGVITYVGSNPDIASNSDLLVFTSAIDDRDKEVECARKRGIPTLARHEFLSIVAKEYESMIAVAGTHGKTTVTSMLTAIFKTADYPFASHIGGISNDINSNYYHKGNQLFITEACEYKRSFLSLNPTCGIILNIDHDHPDTYKTKEELYDAFTQFSNKSEFTLINSNYNSIISADEHTFTFGMDDSQFHLSNISEHANEKYAFDLCLNGHMLIEDIRLPIYGIHNVYNAIAAAAAASMWGIRPEHIRKGLNNYKGVQRRFELKGRFKGAEIITDYAHHPDEIKAVIKSARKITEGKLIVIYEPHTYSRTKALIEQFKYCFGGADLLIILPTYAAREKSDNGMDSLELIDNIELKPVLYAKDYYEARSLAVKDIEDNDKVLVLGAGSIVKLSEMLVEVQ